MNHEHVGCMDMNGDDKAKKVTPKHGKQDGVRVSRRVVWLADISADPSRWGQSAPVDGCARSPVPPTQGERAQRGPGEGCCKAHGGSHEPP